MVIEEHGEGGKVTPVKFVLLLSCGKFKSFSMVKAGQGKAI